VLILGKEVRMAVNLEPMADRVIVKPIEKEEVTKGGLVIPDTAKEKPQEGEVIAVGPGRLSEDGKRIPVDVKKGDRVIYAKFAGTELKYQDVDYLVLRESDILARVGKAGKPSAPISSTKPATKS
jgi:chaperonin GroES